MAISILEEMLVLPIFKPTLVEDFILITSFKAHFNMIIKKYEKKIHANM